MNQAITNEPLRLVGWDGSDVPATDNDEPGEELHVPTVRRMIAELRQMSAGNAADILERQITRGWVKLDEEDVHRSKWCNGMRDLADFIESTPTIPVPTIGGEYNAIYLPITVDWQLSGDEKRQAERVALAKVVRALPGKIDKEFDDYHLNIKATIGDAHVMAYVAREAVCKKVETKVTKTRKVLPPEHREIQLVDEEYESVKVEWVCDEPILGGAR